MQKLKSNKDFLLKILEEGSNKANLVASNNLKEIKKIVGLSE